MLVWERDKIIKDGSNSSFGSVKVSGGGAKGELTTAALNEEKKVQALKRRQKAKMEQAILFEIRSQQAEAQHQANLAEQNAREERERKARERRKRELEDGRRELRAKACELGDGDYVSGAEECVLKDGECAES